MTLPILQLKFDASANAIDVASLNNLNGATDLIVLAHGFRCRPADATRLYRNLMANLTPQLPARQFAVAGVYWPSEKFQESYPLFTGKDDPTEGLPLLGRYAPEELLEKLHGDVDMLRNFLTFMAMKYEAGRVGANGLAPAIAKLTGIRIHLIGHSLGARLVTACCKALAEQNAKPVASLSLLEAAFSHYGFSPEGYFRKVIESQIVKGPMIATFSRLDLVVGKAYAVASRLAHDNLTAIGDSSDHYGGIGHNGARDTIESEVIPLHRAPQPYAFESGTVTCLDGSAGLISGHDDVTNPNVTWAIASAIKATE
jgi:pimeloyl-ACP methyl ester carboxylesterase